MPDGASMRNPKILVFTDSRGQHKRSFADRPIFPERLKHWAEARGGSADLLLCPYKWTTTLDFIELVERGIVEPRHYDKVILYTGIVEWSPRDVSNYRACVEGEGDPLQWPELYNSYRPKRSANHKLAFLREFFGAADFDAYAATRFTTEYRNEPTQNLVSLKMLWESVIPHLRKTIGTDRLIWINANRFVPGWDGNYLAINPDGRPANMRIIEEYAETVRDEVPSCLNLLEWSPEEIQAYTVDNMHLTHAGSEWMFEQLVAMLS